MRVARKLGDAPSEIDFFTPIISLGVTLMPADVLAPPQLRAVGLLNKEVASELGISETTSKAHG